jgi:hypothetical protein
MNLKKAAIVAGADLLIFGELALAIHLGNQDPENVALVFFRTFLPLAALTIWGCRFVLRRVCPEPAPEERPPAGGGGAG